MILLRKCCNLFTKFNQDGGKDRQSGKMKIAVGPWGGHGGTSWDDGCYQGVREITVVYDRCIDSISVVYDKNAKPFKAEKHGGLGGNKVAEVRLLHPISKSALYSESPSYAESRVGIRYSNLTPTLQSGWLSQTLDSSVLFLQKLIVRNEQHICGSTYF